MSNNQVIKREKPKFSVAINTTAYQALINSTLRDPHRVQRFVSAITSAVAVNPQLQECDAGSILSGALLGESLNLSPSPQLGQYYLVPFNTKDKATNTYVKKAQFVLGYKGYIQLAIRSGQYRDIDAMEVHEGEYLGRDAQTGQPKFQFIEDDDIREKAPIIGYMAYFEYLNGFRKSIYWTKEKMLQHADTYSNAFSASDYAKYVAGQIPEADLWKYSSHWYKNFDGMAKKTMLRQLITKWGIMSIEMQEGIVNDSGMIQIKDGNFISTPESEAVEAQPVETPTPPAEEPAKKPPVIVPGQQVNLADL